MTREIVVLGLGSIGLRHAGNLIAAGRKVAGFDTDAARRHALAGLGGRPLAQREAALDAAADGGAIVIASPSGRHHADVLDALARGSHVFVEKPFAHRLDGLEAALRGARSQGQIVFAAHNLRYHPAVKAAHALLAADGLGPVFWARAICASYLPDWRPAQDYRTGYAADLFAGGVILDVVHEFDLAAHLLGPFETRACVARRSGALDLPSEDVADILLAHEDGVVTSLHLDYVTRPPVRRMDIAGARGRIELDLLARRFRHFETDGRIVAETLDADTQDADYRREMDDFLACLDGTAAPRCDGAAALAVLRRVLDARALAGLPSAGEGAAVLRQQV